MSELASKEWSAEETAGLHLALSDDSPLIDVADFSPGPWWGFNGVLTLAMTSTTLHIARRKFLGGHKLKESHSISDIETVKHLDAGSRVGLRARIKFRNHRSMTLTSKYKQSENLLNRLLQIVNSE